MEKQSQSQATLPNGLEKDLQLLLDAHPEIEKISGCAIEKVDNGGKVEDRWLWGFRIQLKDVRVGVKLVELEFKGDRDYPWSEVSVYTDDYVGMPHQKLRDGKICLDPDVVLDADSSKLEKTYGLVLNWLQAAKNGVLSKNGDLYEVPDFEHRYQIKCQKSVALLYANGDDLYGFLLDDGRTTGSATLIEQIYPDGLNRKYYLKGLTTESACIDFPHCNWCCGSKRIVPYIIVDDIVVENHRPPIYWHELLEKISATNPNFEKKLEAEWKRTEDDIGQLLVGWRIPYKYGESLSSISWQIANFPSRQWEVSQIKSKTPNCNKKKQEARQWCNAYVRDAEAAINWSHANNVGHSEILFRWQHPQELRDARISIVGCGALGSQVAELMARGGCTNIVLIDADYVEYGNLCRHTLTAKEAFTYKSDGLEARLRNIMPNGNYSSIVARVPDSSKITSVIRQSDLVLDLTGDIQAGMWLSKRIYDSSVRGVRAFMSGRVDYLSLCLSGKNKSLRAVEAALIERARQEPVEWNGFDKMLYFSDENIRVSGIGCWHPTFPGSWTNITIFASVIVNRIADWMKNEYTYKGEHSIYACSCESGTTTVRMIEQSVC